MNPAWESIRISVCRRCIDGDKSGTCRLPAGEICPLESSFPIVVDVILAEKGRPADAIAATLRARVCSQCSVGSAHACRLRDTLECALERYLPQIIERISSMHVGWARM